MTVQSDESLYFQIDKAERSLQRTIDWVSRHDVRSNGLFGISIAMMGMLSTVVPPFSQWNVEIAISISLTVVSFIVTITSLLLGVLPRTTTQTQSILFLVRRPEWIATICWQSSLRRHRLHILMTSSRNITSTL